MKQEAKNHASEDKNEYVEIGPSESHVRRAVIGTVTVLLFIASRGIMQINEKQYIYRKLQRESNGNSTLPGHSNETITDTCGHNVSVETENSNQSDAAKWIWYFSVVESGLGLITVIFYGIYSDYIGRKPLMIISVVGYIINSALTSVFVYKDFDLKYLFIPLIVSGLCGAQFTFNLGITASVADNTERNKSRSIGIAIVDALVNMGFGVSQLAAGYIIKYLGFFYPVLIATALMIVTLIVVLAFNKDTLTRTSTKQLTFLVGVKRMFGFYYKKSQLLDGMRWKFNIAFLSYFIIYLLNAGRYTLEVLYQMRSPFCWTSEIIGWYGFISFSARYIIGTLLMTILQKCIPDEFICVLSILSAVASAIIIGLASSTPMLYISAAAGIINSLCFPLLRAICSKQVPSDLQGAAFTNLFVMESICIIAATSIFNNVYGLTQSTMPGVVFLAIAALFVAPLLLVIVLAVSNRRRNSSKGDHQ